MLRKLSSNFKEFKTINFKPGFNVILAEKAPGATEKHSRNARGKTTLIQVINYCLGGNLAKPLKPLGAAGWEFTLELDIFNGVVSVTRHVQKGTRVRIGYSPNLADILEPYLDENSTASIDDWKYLLGLSQFGLDLVSGAGERSISPRTLLSYVVRTDAVKDPFKVIPQQPAWSSREHVSYLLNLNWELVRDLSLLEEEGETYKAIAKATKKNLLPRSLRPEPELMLELAEAQRDLDLLKSRLSGFQVVEDPQGLIERADRITEQLKELRNEAVVDRRMIQLYEKSLQEEPENPSAEQGVSELYAEMQRAFTPEALRSLETVTRFHSQLMENRKRFLSSELDRIKRQAADRDAKIGELMESRNSILAIMDAGGALEELAALQAETNQASSKVAEIETSLATVRDVAQAQEDVRLKKAQLRTETARDLSSNRRKLDSVAARFDRMMQDLYGVGGVLTAEVDDLGYKFTLKVATSASGGVTRMQLLCFDLTLLAEGVGTKHHPGFLIHDSVVFDGVDPRQIASSLNLIADTVGQFGGQYICTMNSNDVPVVVKEESWFKDGICRIILDTEKGGALGVSF